MWGRFLMGVPFGYAWVRVLGYKAFGLSPERNTVSQKNDYGAYDGVTLKNAKEL